MGEETGNLDVTMKGLAAYYEREENTMQDIRSAISYPLMILCMLLTIML
ncbi:MAG: type II secretion system F family protein [Anaerobutyricum soehngenii]